MALTACSQRAECPKQTYPKLEAIERVPDFWVTVDNGALDQNSTKIAFSAIKALRVSENYYYTLISQYRKDFNNGI